MKLFDQTDPEWPPNPGEIDLNHNDWMTVQQLAYRARVGERTIRRHIAERNVSILVGGKRWISVRRYFAQ